jgi:hypothetical protein
MHHLLVGLNVPAFKTREVNKHISAKCQSLAYVGFLLKNTYFWSFFARNTQLLARFMGKFANLLDYILTLLLHGKALEKAFALVHLGAEVP